MANNCSVNIKPDKLPIVLKKVEFYVYRAVERSGINFLDLPSASAEVKLNLLSTARELLEADIINYSKKAAKLGAETENGKAYAEFAANLQGINVNWDEATAYFSKYFGGVLNLKTRFKLDQEGLIDLDETADEEAAFLSKYVFDQPANEIDPVDNIDKGIELFLRSLKREGIYDDYGFNVLVDYGSFVRRLSTDLENTVTIEQIVVRLEDLQKETPEYKVLLDKLTFKPTDKAEDLQFKINFRNSFAKALIPIYITSFENGTVKVIEATVAKRSLYEQIINSNFLRRGMMVSVNGKKGNLAHLEGSSWVLTKDDIPKIQRFMDERNIPAGQKRERYIQFLESLGFEFSEQSREKLLQAKNIDTVVSYIYTHLIKVLESGAKVKEPIKEISKNVYIKGKPSYGQKGNINTIIEFEVKYNRNFNVERSMINQDGNRQHAIQNHNNFTIVNKYLSDPITYPTLQSIIAAEPSLFWIDPVTNPSIANSLYLNSLFFYSPEDPNFGARRRVVKQKNGARVFSATEGEFVQIIINNTGGIQVKDEMGFKTDSAGSTSMESGDKLIQDINTFIYKGFTSVQRLSDKSTDLGIYLNYYVDPTTGIPVDRILGGATGYSSIYATDQFIELSIKTLKDILKMKFLASKGFYSGLAYSGKSITGKNNFGVFDDVLTTDTKEILNLLLEGVKTVEDIDGMLLEKTEEREVIAGDIQEYMEEYSERFKEVLKPITSIVNTTAALFGKDRNNKERDLNETIDYYLANTFLSDIENLKVFFGESIFFKQFHKRSSKDAATGIFTTAEDAVIEKLNDYSDAQGYGANTNLAGRMLIERLFQTGVINKEQRDQALMKQTVSKSFKSAVIKDVMFDSRYISVMKSNIEKLYNAGSISKEQYNLYKENLEKVITEKYKDGTEADGQGKVTFDFYRIISILTSNWGPKQEEVYKKIVMYSHYQDLIEAEQDEAKRAEYVILRDAIGYDPTEQVYFPPKKFQYTGPMEYLKSVLGNEYGQMIPVFDKFSLQPLIPTLIKNTADEQLAKRMEYNGIGYVKFESGSKAETPSAKDDYYLEYDPTNTESRKVFTLEQLIENGKEKFKSEQTLFMSHLKDQVRIDNDVHEDTIFGSQIRKLLLLNILGSDTTFKRQEFTRLYDKYVGLINSLIKAEKRDLYSKMGVREDANHNLSVSNIKKLVEYFFTEIDRKNQDSNVRKALKYNEQTKQFDIPLDGAVQAQLIEGIIISSINNRIVRHRSNGSMLTQVAITGSERIKFSKEKSKEALETFGNTELGYYTVEEENGKPVVTAMQVKIGFTKQWLPLLELIHPDGNRIGSLERLNEALKDKNWKKTNRDSIRMGAYRIPTQGLNFAEVMEVAEFLPAAFGDAIILPSEIVIKSGSDFDIDKLFVFYPNLNTEGDEIGKPVALPGDKRTIENELYKTMFEIILHPSNYIQLVTPSEQFHILPIINEVYKKIYGTERQKTDYKNTQLVDRDYNMRKFLSLLKGKSDLGIAAIANTFNVLFQLVGAKASTEYLKQSGIRSFFQSKTMEKVLGTNIVTGINYADIYDEDGVFKSEFFAEFISAFVDVAKDDYVFAVNVVTELSPVIFYMKFMGLSTEKIINFINQPAIRNYIKNLSKYENITVKSYLESEKLEIQKKLSGLTQADINEDDKLKRADQRLKKLKYSTRKKALSETLRSLGFSDVLPTRQAILKRLSEGRKITAFDKFFTADTLSKTLKSDEFNISELSDDMKLVQLSMLFELENLKLQSDSLTDAQSFLNFDTKPYKSVFDVYLRNEKYKRAKTGDYILSSTTVERIRNLSPIAPLNADVEIRSLASSLFPVRNNEQLNSEILNEAAEARSNINVPSVRSEGDMETFARTFRNDLMSFILYNYLDKSQQGLEFFKKEFNTDKTLVEYVKELVETPKLLDQYNKIKDMDEYQALIKQYPFVQNILVRTGDRNPNLLSFKLVESSSHSVDKESVIAQFEEVVNLSSKENEDIRMFFRNLALYSTFQSGYNYGEFSYTAVTPEFLINKLYGEAAKEFMTLSPSEKSDAYQSFKSLFVKNNPLFYEDRASYDTPTNEPNKRGKWYAEATSLNIKKKIDAAAAASKNPLTAAGVRPSDMGGNAAKDIKMADEATQFIGFKSGDAAVSSTDRYRVAWGGRANTGRYTSEDLVMVSASGAFRGVTREQIFDTFEQKYQSLLNNAIEVNANFVVGNRYDKGNVGDFLVAEYLKKKGYMEEKFDGYSKWIAPSKVSQNEFDIADRLSPIEQNFADSAARRMRPEFAGKSTMDLIISGDRTRTTRSKTEINRMVFDYKLNKINDLVGKVIRMTDKKGRVVYTRITKVVNFTKEYQDKTWMKEGWVKEVTDKLIGQYPYAIEFELVSRPTVAANADVSNPNISDIENKINSWIEKEIPWTITTPASELAKMYETEKLQDESIEEFLHRLSCKGKLI